MPSNTARIAKNTLMLYFRQILIMLVSLYTVRVVLNTLGAEDYGIYNVAAGVVAMLGFLSNSMATASQRYFSFEIGRGDFEQLKKVFSVSLTIYILIAVVVIALGETVGLWLVSNKLVIPADRKDAAYWIYQFAILSFLFAMITTPYMASIIAHENMDVYAYVSIVEVALRLLIVFMLLLIPADKLIIYGILMFAVTFINTGIYRFVCTKKYNECRFRFHWDYSLFKELTSYVGWNLLETISTVIKNQGINVLLNIYFGPLVNAARAISAQVDHAIVNFSHNFTTAIKPQIVKYYASRNQEQMLSLVFLGARTNLLLLFFFTLPLQLELDFILNLWLKNIPEYVIVFTRIILVNSLIDAIGSFFGYALQATGKIKLYQVVIGIIYILNLPIALIFLNLGFSAISVQIIGLILSIFGAFARIILLSRQVKFSIMAFFKNVLIPSVVVFIISSIIPIFFVIMYPAGIIRLILTVIFSITSVAITTYFLGISSNERSIIVREIKRRIHFNKEKNNDE